MFLSKGTIQKLVLISKYNKPPTKQFIGLSTCVGNEPAGRGSRILTHVATSEAEQRPLRWPIWAQENAVNNKWSKVRGKACHGRPTGIDSSSTYGYHYAPRHSKVATLGGRNNYWLYRRHSSGSECKACEKRGTESYRGSHAGEGVAERLKVFIAQSGSNANKKRESSRVKTTQMATMMPFLHGTW